MKLLLDTHIFLWFISGDARLPDSLRESIRNLDHDVYLSVVSLWKAILKHQLGKLPFFVLCQDSISFLPQQRGCLVGL